MKYLNPMYWLLKAQGYPPAVLFSVGLHVFLVWIMWDHDFVPANLVDLDEPIIVRSSVVQENPQKLRRLEDQTQRSADAEAQRRERERAAEEQRQREAREREQQQQAARDERERAEQQRLEQEQAEQNRINRERQEQERLAAETAAREEAERLEREVAERVARENAEREAAALAASQQAAADNEAISSYMAVIYDTVSGNWILPPSARNGMTAVIRLNLVPTGEIVNYALLTSSGDSAFDRSTLQAVARAERFPELQQMPSRIFETQFRTVDLTFRPEDLLR